MQHDLNPGSGVDRCGDGTAGQRARKRWPSAEGGCLMSEGNFSPSISMEVKIWPIDRLIPYARNPRKNDQAVDRMCASLREFGFKIPCLVRSDGEVVDGHLRLKAARKLGITEIQSSSAMSGRRPKSKLSGSWSTAP